MQIGVLGTGMVGQAIGSKLVELGHEVVMGSRSARSEKAVAWAAEAGEGAGEGAYADAAAHGEIVFNCTAGVHSIAALDAAGDGNLSGKTLVDIALPLDFSQTPPILAFCNDDSLGETIQRHLPEAKVVKTLCTVNSSVMVDPGSVPGDHVMPICGDEAAKPRVIELLGQFGWPEDRVIDLGDISSARGMEMYIALWLRIWGSLGSLRFNIALAR